ncbi:DUF935 family protein, partial [Okeania sp. SIO2B9]|uniref:phage portal protein family protein n=1 Tax=Okeania sp. SIO2B9 TaxID=2607782 RepID=UPI00142CC908
MARLVKLQKQEIATVNNQVGGIYPFYGGRLSSRDELFLNMGKTEAYEVLRDVLRDPHCSAVTQKRWLSVVGREIEVRPASDRRIDKKAADLVKAQIERLGNDDDLAINNDLIPGLTNGFDRLCYSLLKGEFYGFQAAEIIWDSDGKEIYPKAIKPKSSKRFVYVVAEDKKNLAFRLLTLENPHVGISLPDKKFIIHTVDPEDDNPYGWGLGSKLYYPVRFKRELARFSLIYADKYGSPTAKATYPVGREDLRDILLEAMQNIAQESGVAIPNECDLEWMTVPTGTGVDIYSTLMDYYDREMSKAVLGETGSTDQQGEGGSRARD